MIAAIYARTVPVRPMIVVPTYRGHRIEVNAVEAESLWNAEVRIRRLLFEDKPRVENVACLKLTRHHAERAGEIWARRWVDVKAGEDGT
jgi:hypothetical protein